MTKSIHSVVIPAAGLGTRFLPATAGIPKELLPINGVPAILFVLDEAMASGLDSAILVSAECKKALSDYFSTDNPILRRLDTTQLPDDRRAALDPLKELIRRIKFRTVHQRQPLGLGHAVLTGIQDLDEGFAVILPDDILVGSEPVLKQMLEIHRRTDKGVVALQRVPKQSVSAYGIASLAREQGEADSPVLSLAGLVEKPHQEKAPSDLAVVGRYVLPAETKELLKEAKPGAGGEIQLTDALNELAKKGKLLGYQFEARRFDVGNPVGMLEAAIYFAIKNGMVDKATLIRHIEVEK